MTPRRGVRLTKRFGQIPIAQDLARCRLPSYTRAASCGECARHASPRLQLHLPRTSTYPPGRRCPSGPNDRTPLTGATAAHLPHYRRAPAPQPAPAGAPMLALSEPAPRSQIPRRPSLTLDLRLHAAKLAAGRPRCWLMAGGGTRPPPCSNTCASNTGPPPERPDPRPVLPPGSATPSGATSRSSLRHAANRCWN